MSLAVMAEENARSSSSTAANRSALRCLSSMTFSSMVFSATIRYTMTFLDCPMRCVRSTAWFSVAGFHHGSNR